MYDERNAWDLANKLLEIWEDGQEKLVIASLAQLDPLHAAMIILLMTRDINSEEMLRLYTTIRDSSPVWAHKTYDLGV